MDTYEKSCINMSVYIMYEEMYYVYKGRKIMFQVNIWISEWSQKSFEKKKEY